MHKKWYDYLWIWSIVYFTLGFFNILFAWLGMIDFLVPQYIKEGKSQFVIAVGCTGGMHRSVYIAKHIFDRLTAQGYSTRLEHRDLMKNDVREHVREEC